MSATAEHLRHRAHANPADRVESVDTRMLVMTRFVLALSALAIIYVDATEPQRLIELTYISLVLYCLYSAYLAIESYKSGWGTPVRATYWIDVFFYVYLIALTEGTNSIFFFFFFFSIMAASFSRGFREGLLVTVTSTVLFTVVGVIAAPAGSEFELNRAMIRPTYLFALGFMIAHWGSYAILLNRRLRLLQEISSLWNPRFGTEHTIGANLDRLLAFYHADTCVLVLKRAGSPPCIQMYNASRQRPGLSSVPNQITESAAGALFGLPQVVGAVYHDSTGPLQTRLARNIAYDIETRTRAQGLSEECRSLANLLDSRALVTVPYAQHDGTVGRIYLASNTVRFNAYDIDFLAQVSATIAIVVENMYLMEASAHRAAEHERLRISRDIHDTTIQPYIGLKLALDALFREAGPEGRLSQRISEIVDMADMTVRDLRTYATTLKEKTPLPGEFLVSAVKKQAERYRRFYGIEIEINSEISVPLGGRVPGEAYQILMEGLSNILRHTTSKNASIHVLTKDSCLVMELINESQGEDVPDFLPRSIDERARELGGTCSVKHTTDRKTVVRVAIPLNSESANQH